MAVFFEEMTEYARALQSQSKVLEEKNRCENQQSHAAMISHEFATPVSTAIDFLKLTVENDLQGE